MNTKLGARKSEEIAGATAESDQAQSSAQGAFDKTHADAFASLASAIANRDATAALAALGLCTAPDVEVSEKPLETAAAGISAAIADYCFGDDPSLGIDSGASRMILAGYAQWPSARPMPGCLMGHVLREGLFRSGPLSISVDGRVAREYQPITISLAGFSARIMASEAFRPTIPLHCAENDSPIRFVSEDRSAEPATPGFPSPDPKKPGTFAFLYISQPASRITGPYFVLGEIFHPSFLGSYLYNHMEVTAEARDEAGRLVRKVKLSIEDVGKLTTTKPDGKPFAGWIAFSDEVGMRGRLEPSVFGGAILAMLAEDRVATVTLQGTATTTLIKKLDVATRKEPDRLVPFDPETHPSRQVTQVVTVEPIPPGKQREELEPQGTLRAFAQIVPDKTAVVLFGWKFTMLYSRDSGSSRWKYKWELDVVHVSHEKGESKAVLLEKLHRRENGVCVPYRYQFTPETDPMQPNVPIQ